MQIDILKIWTETIIGNWLRFEISGTIILYKKILVDKQFLIITLKGHNYIFKNIWTCLTFTVKR